MRPLPVKAAWEEADPHFRQPSFGCQLFLQIVKPEKATRGLSLQNLASFRNWTEIAGQQSAISLPLAAFSF
jgi:hypothetical protein